MFSVLILIFIKALLFVGSMLWWLYNVDLLNVNTVARFLPTCGSGGAMYTCINYAYSRGEPISIFPLGPLLPLVSCISAALVKPLEDDILANSTLRLSFFVGGRSFVKEQKDGFCEILVYVSNPF